MYCRVLPEITVSIARHVPLAFNVLFCCTILKPIASQFLSVDIGTIIDFAMVCLIRLLRGPTPFEDMIFYLWTDSNEICTAYVKLRINHILFVKNF